MVAVCYKEGSGILQRGNDSAEDVRRGNDRADLAFLSLYSSQDAQGSKACGSL